MPSRPLLIVPAAGLGTRLHTEQPKALYRVRGKPMIDYLFDLYEPLIRHVVLVLHPSFEEQVRRHCSSRSMNILYARQEQPTGMLDAILAPINLVRGVDGGRIWVTWCDQIAIHPDTIETLKRLGDEDGNAAMIFPTARQPSPYIHLERGAHDEITNIRQRREGDAMPDIGESDMGLFSLSRTAYLDELPAFAADAGAGRTTRERNFLPFIPWLTRRGMPVRTFPCRDPREAIGINDAEDVRAIEAYLSERDASAPRS